MLGKLGRLVVRPMSALAGNVQMGAKVGLVLVLVLVPLGIVLNDYVGQQSTRIATAKAQQRGIEYLGSVLALDRQVLVARQDAQSGNTAGSSLSSALSSVDSQDTSNAQALGLSSIWQSTRSSIVSAESATGSPNQIVASWNSAQSSIESFISKIADSSELGSEPTTGLTYLNDILTNVLVNYSDYASQELSNSSNTVTGQNQVEIAQLAKIELAKLNSDFSKVASSQDTASLAAQLAGPIGSLSVGSSTTLAQMIQNVASIESQGTSQFNLIISQNISSLNAGEARNEVLAIVMAVLAIWLACGIIVQVRDSSHLLMEAMQKVAQGDVTIQAELQSDDEFGMFAKHLNAALVKIRESLQVIHQKMNSVSASSKDLSSVSSTMSSTAIATSERAAAVSSASEQVNTNVTVVAAAIEEMVASVKEIASNASKASEVAVRASEIATIAGENIDKLETSSIEISNVVSLITSIAEQTNLLALNATIEAARAGEMGKGFAVVANEVKDLAAKTTKATEDISHRIEAIQANTQGATESVSQIRQIVGEINDIQGSIASSVEEQAAAVSEVGRSVSEAAGSTAAIVDNITGVAKSAQETSEGANRNQYSAEQVSEVSIELQQLIGNLLGQFQFGNGKTESTLQNKLGSN